MRAAALAILGLLALTGPTAAQEEPQVAPPPPAAEEGPKLSPAELRADTLDRLFGLLRKASEKDAQRIEENIWKMWMLTDSPSADVVMGRVVKAMADKNYVAAMDMANTLVELHPDYAEAWNKRATIFFIIGRHAESLADITRVLELEPRHFGALSGRGMIFEKEGKAVEALKAFREALSVNPHMKAISEAVKRLEDEAQEI